MVGYLNGTSRRDRSGASRRDIPRIEPIRTHASPKSRRLLAVLAVPALAIAARMVPEALLEVRRQMPKESESLVIYLVRYGKILLTAKRFAEAEPLLRECLAILERSRPEDWRTFDARANLGAALLGQKKYAEAEPLLKSGYEGLKAREKAIAKQDLGPTRISNALDRLIELATATNKPDEAKAWEEERAKLPAEAPKPGADKR